MLYTFLTSAALASLAVGQTVTGALGDAAVVSDNPTDITYTATLPEAAFTFPGPQGNVKGSVVAVGNPDGVGVKFNVKFSNLPTVGGPFMYHIHVAPVPEDGNCTKTLAHQDPYVRGEVPPCDPAKPETCQTGDLSGKWGMVTADPFEDSYVDLYASTKEGLGSFFGNRSIVFHFANKTRITCANFGAKEAPASNGTAMPTGTGSPVMPTASSTLAPYIPGSGAMQQAASLVSVFALAGLVAIMV